MKHQILSKETDEHAFTYKLIGIDGLNLVEKRLNALFEDSDSYINNLCSRVIKSGGKRIRPILALCSGQCVRELNEQIVNSAVAVELIHTASLVHDDIIDNANTRRGVTTINYEVGNYGAVLCGDYLFAEAFKILSYINLGNMEYDRRVMQVCVDAIKEMCDGEIVQAYEKYNWKISEREYMKRIYKKTAALLKASCCIGAISGGGEDETICALKSYGENIGYAFQIVDDIYDYVSDSSTMGKPCGSDLIQGNITLPAILLINQESNNSTLNQIIKKGRVGSAEFEYVKQLIINKGIIDKCKSKAVLYVEKAKSNLGVIKNVKYKSILAGIADMVIEKI